MTDKNFSRRKLLTQSLMVATGAAMAPAMAMAADKACVDMEHLDSGQKSIRESLNYTNTSPDAAKQCGKCGFFEATAGGCGNCMIFSGPAAATGHCDSWSAKG